jgi:putative DNA primase/helicase
MHTNDCTTRPDIPALAQGQWPAIWTDLGIGPEYQTGKHGPCPGCGGRDRFRADDQGGRGTFYCSGGGNPTVGDGFDLLCHVFGWTKAEAFKAVRRWLGLDSTADAPHPRQRPVHAPVAAPRKRSTADYAIELWGAAERSDRVVGSHPYSAAKGIGWAAGAGRGRASGIVVGDHSDCLLIPVRDIRTDLVEAVQAINPAGAKQTFVGVRGRAFICGNTLDKRIPWYVCEGWADAVSIVFHVHKGNAAAFACMGHHFDIVALTVADHFAPDRLIVLEDAA